MKKTAILFVLSGLLMTSCLKDGFHDFDVLNHDMTFHGVISPILGAPVGRADVTIFDMLNMVQLTTAKLEVSDQDIVTITYDTSLFIPINLRGSKGSGSGSKDPDIVHVSRNQVEGAVNVDLFDNIQILDTNDIEVDSLLVYLRAHVKATTEDSLAAIQAMNTYHVLIYYDQVNLQIVGQDNQLYNIVSLYNQPGDSLPIESIIHGDDVVLFNNTDISLAINKRPKQIRYSARMNIAFTAEFFAMSGLSESQFVADSIGLETVNIDAYIKARFPVSAYIQNLNYNVDINFDASIELRHLDMDSSMIYIDCLNGIPLEFALRAQLIDGMGNVLCDLLDPVQTTVAGANVELNPANNLYTSSGQTETLVQIPVTQEIFDYLKIAKKIRLTAGLRTADTGNPLRNRVAIQAHDKLSLRVWAKFKPSYTLNINLGGTTDTTEGGEK